MGDSALEQRTPKTVLEDLIREHAVLVKRIAHHLLMRLPPSVMLDDLIQVGMIGLLEAAQHYDASKGASFETYAGIRIRGHMLDEVRSNDWVPRSVYRNARRVAVAVKKVENRLGREAHDKDIAEELGLTVEAYYLLLKDACGTNLQGFDDLGVTEDTMKGESGLSEPCAEVVHQDTMNQLTHVIEGLPHNERLVLSLYYEQDLNLKEIGEVLSVSESRISQIHTSAVIRIKARLGNTALCS